MVNKHCAYGGCNSDSRYMHKPHMEGVNFVYFPQRRKDPDKCSRWVKLCGRPSEGYRSFTVASVTKNTYICTKHFVGGQGPTFEYPDPIPADAAQVEKKLSAEQKKKQQAPNKRHLRSLSLTTTSACKTKRSRRDRSPDFSSTATGCFKDHLTAGFRGRLTETCGTTVAKRKGGVAVSALASTLASGKRKRGTTGLTILKVFPGKTMQSAGTQTLEQTDSDWDGTESSQSHDVLTPDIKIEIDIAEEMPVSWMPEDVCRAAQRGPERTAKVVGVLVKCEWGADTHVGCQQTTGTRVSCRQTTGTHISCQQTTDTCISCQQTTGTHISRQQTTDTCVSRQQTTDTCVSCQQTTETKPQAARAAAEDVASKDVGVVIKLESEPISDSEPDFAYPIAFWAGTNLRSLLTMSPAAFSAH